jgi:hypothetical protein
VTRDELEHAIRAACDVAGDEAVYVFGSQAILGQYPEAPAALRQSVEVGVAPRTRLDRVIPVRDAVGTHGKTGLCLESHDLAASKLAAFREKDRDFVRVLLVERLITAALLVDRLGALDLPAQERERRVEWVRLTAQGLRPAPRRR